MSNNQESETKAMTAFEQSSIIINKVINDTIKESSNKIIAFMLSLDDKKKIYDSLVEELVMELTRSSFMDMNLELTDDQKEVLRKSSNDIVTRSYDKYKTSILRGKREEVHIDELICNIKDIIDTSISSVGDEINRGAVVPCSVAKCDTSSDKKKIELHYFGDSRITVPTNGFFVSSNSVQTLKDSVIFINDNK